MSLKITLSFVGAAALLAAAPASAQREQPLDGEAVDLGEDGEVAESVPDFSISSEEEEALAELEREINAEFGMLGELFQADPLTEEQEALLPLAQQMTDTIMPVGSFGTVMSETMEPLMTTIMGAVTSDPKFRLAEVTGVTYDDLSELDQDAAQQALDIFDPGYADRTQQMSGVVVNMIGKLFDALEPAYRDAMSRALTTRFEEGEMRELLTFFETPIGAKFAQQSFLVQYDQQMLGVMEQMGPAMMEVMPGMMEEFAAFEMETAQARSFNELSAVERERAAQLIGKSVNELDALEPADEESVEEDIDEYEEA